MSRPPHNHDNDDCRTSELLVRLLRAERFGRLDEVRHVQTAMADLGSYLQIMEVAGR